MHPEQMSAANQPPELSDYCLYNTDEVLKAVVEQYGLSADQDAFLALSKVLGQASAIDLGRQANVYLPEYKSHDTYGHRVDLVEYHPSYHALMKISKEQGIHSAAWTLKAKGHSKRAVLLYLIATA